MSEHLILYMVELYQERKVAEEKLFNFLGSLKYYCERWHRARHYAIMCHFIKNNDISLNQKEEASDPFADIYSIEFYLTAYNYALMFQQKWLESTEGYTYVPKVTEDKISQRLLTYLPP